MAHDARHGLVDREFVGHDASNAQRAKARKVLIDIGFGRLRADEQTDGASVFRFGALGPDLVGS